MLLRANSELNGASPDLKAITAGSGRVSGVAHGELLSRFVELTLDWNAESAALAAARDDLAVAASPAALVDAAAVIGNFQRMVRIADGTGIPLDRPVAIVTAELREELGIDRFGSADNTPKVGRFARWLGARFGRALLRRMARG